MTDAMKYVFDPTHVDLTSEDLDPAKVVCFLSLGENEYNGRLGDRISALFVILAVSSAATFFPVIATRVPRLRIPVYVYLFARYFGAGVIIATAFIQYVHTISAPLRNTKVTPNKPPRSRVRQNWP